MPETGALLLANGSGRLPTACLLPEIRMAVLCADDILERHTQALALREICDAYTALHI